MDSYNPSLSPFSIFLSDQLTNRPNDQSPLTFPEQVDTLLESLTPLRRMADAKENESKADEMLLKRCAYHGLNFSAPFVVMRHWDKMRQEGNYWCGEFETDDVDWQLAELIVNMQYACQRHYFGALAEAYFDNKLREAAVNVQRQQKTVEGFNRLPEEFTANDVEKCFCLCNQNSIKSRIKRLIKDNLIFKSGEYSENGTVKAKYKKTGKSMI